MTIYLAWIATFAIAAPPTTNSELVAARATLARHGIAATPASTLAWLAQLHQPGPLVDSLQTDLDALADEDFLVRQAATQRLEAAPFVPPRLLDAAIAGTDAERKWRALQIRERADNRQACVLGAALRVVVSAGPQPDLVPSLVDALPLARHADLRADFLAEIRRLAAAEDRPALRRRLAAADPLVRQGAIAGLAARAGTAERDALLPYLDDPQDPVALEAARGLLDGGDRRALAALVQRLASPDVVVRAQAFGLLRAATHQELGFNPHDPLDGQAPALAAWRQWLAGESTDAALDLPIRWRPTGRGDLAGHTLVSTGRRGQILEFDHQGKVVWRYAAAAWSAEKLPNGNVLIAAQEARRILEVDAVGNTVWQLTGIAAIRAKPLANGNLLVADFSGQRVLEINRRHTVVWQLATPEPCFDAERLPNGHTVFGCANLVREVSPDQRTVREWPISGRLNGLQVLSNGSLLVANFGANQVVELDGDGREVWQFQEPQPSDAYRLPDGHTLITSSSRIVEIDGDKHLVREWTKSAYGSARR